MGFTDHVVGAFQHEFMPGLVAESQALGMSVNPWTVNEADDLRRVIDLGVDAIITNHPDRAAALL